MKNKVNVEKKNESDSQQGVLGQILEKQHGEIVKFEADANKIKESVKLELDDYQLKFISIENSLKKEIEESEKKLKDIEDRVRKVVSEQAVKEAQKEFETASKTLGNQIWIWVVLSTLSIFSGFCFAFHYLIAIPGVYDSWWNWKGVFQTSIRITVLTGIWTLSAFFIKMFRAYLQMYHQNLHRMRIANSMSSFIDGSSEHQRDILLSKLVESITDFGNPGIIKSNELKSPSNNIIENITKFIPKTQ